jgi:hypothetical protein
MIPINYVPIEYPKVKYHADQPPVTVANADAEAALGPGWYDSPALVVARPPGGGPVAPAGITPEQVAEFYAAKVGDLVAKMAAAPDEALEDLRMLRDLEAAHPRYKGGRPNVLRAIDARIAALTGES